MVHMHNGILFRHKKKKKKKIMPFAATWIELESLKLSEVSEKEKDREFLLLLSGNEPD